MNGIVNIILAEIQKRIAQMTLEYESYYKSVKGTGLIDREFASSIKSRISELNNLYKFIKSVQSDDF